MHSVRWAHSSPQEITISNIANYQKEQKTQEILPSLIKGSYLEIEHEVPLNSLNRTFASPLPVIRRVKKCSSALCQERRKTEICGDLWNWPLYLLHIIVCGSSDRKLSLCKISTFIWVRPSSFVKCFTSITFVFRLGAAQLGSEDTCSSCVA